MSTATDEKQNGASDVNVKRKYAQSQWIFSPSDLTRTPSIVEGMAASKELANRQKGVNFITQVGIMLKLPQLTLATASVFLHRFYMRQPMQLAEGKGFHHYTVAATALFLATKVEENCRKMKELIVACCRVAQKQPNLVVDDQSKEFWKWRDTLLHNEDLLLENLCFDLQLDQPYRIWFDLMVYYGVQDHKILRNTSWAFLNDSHITTLCLLHSPKTIACSALYVGLRFAGLTLRDDDQGRSWWEHLEVDIREIQKACNQMAEVYESSTIPRQGQKDAYLKDEDTAAFDRTRRTQSPIFEPSPAYSTRSTSQGVKRDREDSWGHDRNSGSGDPLSAPPSAIEQAQPSPKRQRMGEMHSDDAARQPRAPTSNVSSLNSVPIRGLEGQHNHGKSGAPDQSDVSGPARLPPQATRRPEPAAQTLPDTHDNDDQRTTANDAGKVQQQVPAREARRSSEPDGRVDDADYGSEEGEV